MNGPLINQCFIMSLEDIIVFDILGHVRVGAL